MQPGILTDVVKWFLVIDLLFTTIVFLFPINEAIERALLKCMKDPQPGACVLACLLVCVHGCVRVRACVCTDCSVCPIVRAVRHFDCQRVARSTFGTGHGLRDREDRSGDQVQISANNKPANTTNNKSPLPTHTVQTLHTCRASEAGAPKKQVRKYTHDGSNDAQTPVPSRTKHPAHARWMDGAYQGAYGTAILRARVRATHARNTRMLSNAERTQHCRGTMGKSPP